MSDPFDVLKNADPGRDLGSPAEHWRIRERIIVDSVTKTNSRAGAAGADRPRWVGAIASVVALVAGTALLSNTLGGGLPTIALSGSGRALSASAEGADLDAKMMWMGNYEFTLADGVDIAAGSADVWRWPQIDRGDARAIARQLGEEGDLVKVPADMGGGWQIPADDEMGVTLNVSADGSWYWWDPAANPWATVRSGCVEPVTPEGGAVDDDAARDSEGCVNTEPPPAENLPSDSEARAAARDILAGGGAMEIRDVWRDKWSVWVTVEYIVEGYASGQYASVGFGANGAVTSANGQIGTPDKVGAYPTISARDAVVRLLSGPFPYGPAVMSRSAEGGPAPDMAVSGGVISSDGSSDDSSTDAADGDTPDSSEPGASEPSSPPVDVTPIDEMPPIPMETIEVELVKVELTYTVYWGADNIRWLLPSYLYTDSNGGTWTVLAIEEKYLGTEPPPTTIVPVDTTVPEPEPTPEPTDTTVVDPVDTTIAKPEEPGTGTAD